MRIFSTFAAFIFFIYFQDLSSFSNFWRSSGNCYIHHNDISWYTSCNKNMVNPLISNLHTYQISKLWKMSSSLERVLIGGVLISIQKNYYSLLFYLLFCASTNKCWRLMCISIWLSMLWVLNNCHSNVEWNTLSHRITPHNKTYIIYQNL